LKLEGNQHKKYPDDDASLDASFQFHPDLTMIERSREDGAAGGFVSAAPTASSPSVDELTFSMLRSMSTPIISPHSPTDPEVSAYRLLNDRKSKLMCILHDHPVAPLSKWRLNQARGKNPRLGWHPAVPLRLVYDVEERELEMMPTFQRQEFNIPLFARISDVLEAHEGELDLGDYKILLRRCGEAGDYVGCEKIMRTMAERDVKPDAECFFHWVNGCSENFPTKGLKIVTNLMKVPGGSANISVNLYNLTLQLLFDTGMHYEQSTALLRRMKEEGKTPNAATYSLVIRSATRANEIEDAWEVFEEVRARRRRGRCLWRRRGRRE
jgi:pentatricopeptide repeat protein